VKETCTNSLEARTALNVLDQFTTHKVAKESGDVAALKKLGDTIRAAKHTSEFSEWVYEKPDDVTALETQTDTLISDLDTAAAAKREVLDDDLAREVGRPSLCDSQTDSVKEIMHQFGRTPHSPVLPIAHMFTSSNHPLRTAAVRRGDAPDCGPAHR
jgi:hypothetical protein